MMHPTGAMLPDIHGADAPDSAGIVLFSNLPSLAKGMNDISGILMAVMITVACVYACDV